MYTLREVTLAFVSNKLVKQLGQVLGTKVDTPNLWLYSDQRTLNHNCRILHNLLTVQIPSFM